MFKYFCDHKLLMFLVLILEIKSILTLECYHCHVERGICKKEDMELKECPTRKIDDNVELQPICRYTTQWLSFSGKERIINKQDCAYHHPGVAKCSRFKYPEAYVIACYCTYDGCNSSFKNRAFYVLLLIIYGIILNKIF